MSPDDLPIDDPPRQFPDWMRRLDPRLAAEDTNALFRAFLIRRKVHPTGRRAAFASIYHVLRVTTLVVLALAAFPLIRHWPFAPAGTVLVIMMLMGGSFFLLQGIMMSAGTQETRFPLSVLYPFSPHKPSRLAATDIWLLGRPVEEVLEAAYLESCIGAAGFALRMVGILMAADLVFLLGMTYFVPYKAPSSVVMAYGATPVLLVGLLVAFAVLGRVSTAHSVDRLLSGWKTRVLGKRVVARVEAEPFGLRGCLQAVVGSILVVLLVWGIAWSIPVVKDMATRGAVGAFLADPYGRFILAQFCAAFGLCAISLLQFRAHQYYWQRAMLRAPAIFDAWVSTVIFEDPDGLDGALRAHNMTLEDFINEPHAAVPWRWPWSKR